MNKRIVFAAAFLLLALSFQAQETVGDVRISQLFNFGWKFKAGEQKDAQTIGYDDSSWRALDLPHDFQIEQPWDQSAGGARGFKAMGSGWYRKAFTADPTWKGKRVLLDFEGIMLVGDVWLNGQKVGGTDYGYLGFEVDVTKLLHYDKENVVAVKASTGELKNSRWYTGGGLFRDVHLVVKDSVAIARHGVFIHTPAIAEKKADVQLQVEVEGIKGKQWEVEIIATVFSPSGKQVGEVKTIAPKKSKKATDEVLLPLLHVEEPELWSCETPNLYTAEVALSCNGKIVDKVTQRFGIRTLEYAPEFGFKLNGKKVILKGIANHHDLGVVGVAAYERAIERQMDKLKEFGYNHIRTSHNPYSESFLRIADEKGILIVDELYDKWSQQYAGGRIPWTELWSQNIPEWIKRDRNHPSVIMWSFGNELQIVEGWIGYQTGDWGVTSYRILDVLAKRYDPTRKTTVAMYPARKNAIGHRDSEFLTELNPPELSVVTDISSHNYTYPGFREYAKRYPHLILYQSEATTYEMGKPYLGMDLDKVVGIAYWGAIEYWGESNGWPRKGWAFSYFDHALQPYPQAYLIKSLFSDEPLVHIGVVNNDSESIEWNDVVVGRMSISSHWNHNPGSHLNVVTYTNAEEVELFLNGKSLGVQKNVTDLSDKRNAIFWRGIAYNAGKLVAVARTAGKEIARHELETTGKAVALRLEADYPDWKADGLDLQYVRVYAVDAKGRVVPTANGSVEFEVSGAARLIATDNGDHTSDELPSDTKRTIHKGFALAVLRAGQTAGKVKIKVMSAELKGAEKILSVGK